MTTPISVCTGKICSERHSKYILARLSSDVERFGKDTDFTVESCTCRGSCQEWPVVLFGKEMTTRMNPVKASELLMKRIELYKQSKKSS